MATRTVSNLTAVLQMNNTKFKSGLKGSQRAMGGFQKQMVAMKGMIAATFAIGAITNFTRTAFKALDTQRKAEAALLTALKGRVDVQQALIQQAQDLQKLTLFGDEETIKAQAMIAAFVRTEATLKKVTPLVQDMATALQMDLSGAASLVAKTLGSSTNALSRYGITVTGAVGSSERLRTLTDALSEAFEGQSIAAAEVDVSLTQLKNRWGDLKEAMAAVIIDLGPATKEFFNALTEEKIGTWDKFLSLFNPMKALEISAIASVINDVTEANEKLRSGGIKTSGPTSMGTLLKALALQNKQEAAAAVSPVVPVVKQTLEEFIKENDIRRASIAFSNLLQENMSSNIKNAFSKADPIDVDLWDFLFDEDPEEIFEPELDKLIAGFGDVQDEAVKLGEMVGVMMVSQFDKLGDAIGKTMMGAEGALQSLGESILANLGNILIMAGLQMGPAGLPLIIAGAGLQLGSGLFGALGSSTPDVVRTNTAGASVNFRISGNDLVGVMDRNNYQQNINT